MKKPEQYIVEITAWASSQNAIQSLALVGSHARKQARPDSDIDFILLCHDKAFLLKGLSWLNQFGEVKTFSCENWGIVTSIRVFYQDGLEIEFGIAPLSWADIPVGPGTRRVVSDGIIVLKDTNQLLNNLVKSVQ